jgi:hypothetical protein
MGADHIRVTSLVSLEWKRNRKELKRSSGADQAAQFTLEEISHCNADDFRAVGIDATLD